MVSLGTSTTRATCNRSPALAAEVGDVDILMNNAGIARFDPFLELEPAVIEQIVAVDLIGPMVLAHHIVPGMIGRGRGVVINTASQLAFAGAEGRAAYAAAKAGMVQFTKTADRRVGPARGSRSGDRTGPHLDAADRANARHGGTTPGRPRPYPGRALWHGRGNRQAGAVSRLRRGRLYPRRDADRRRWLRGRLNRRRRNTKGP